jgi:Ca2+/Na+ antiporter
LGNILGSGISNILGAFSLGLVLQAPSSSSNLSSQISFDRSSRIYCAILLVITALVCACLLLLDSPNAWKALGGCLCAAFAIYLGSIAYGIRKGLLHEPEGSDSDSDSDSDTTDDETSNDSDNEMATGGERNERESLITSARQQTSYNGAPKAKQAGFPKPKKPAKSTLRHISLLVFGLLAIVLSGFVLSEAATNIIDALGISDMLFGVIILSIATTLPEKFIAVMSGSRNQLDIMCATTVGSNIFLLTLCLGVLLLGPDGDLGTLSAGRLEIGSLAGATLLLTATVFTGMRYARVIGIAMLVLYVVFLGAESYVRK